MDLRRKLARLRDTASPRAAPPEAPDAPAGEAAPDDEALRARLRARRPRGRLRDDAPPWPFEATTTEAGVIHRARTALEHDAAHGDVALARALALTGRQAATLALDPSLADYDAARALFLDLETTGLAGGTGTLAFLVAAARFEDGRLVVEQLLLDDPEHEAPMLERVAGLVREASALVTFNGRAFDLPLLRSRFVMARVPPPAAPPHLDLLHVARRIYGARVERCTLQALERDALGFVREGDVDGADIPARYQRLLRREPGAREAMLPVVRHSVWDVLALAALAGELGARLARVDADGSLHPRDLVGLARTTERAGDADLAILLADDAAARSVAEGDTAAARDAHHLAASIHKRRRDADAMRARLLDALTHAPDDAALHLELARCYERHLDDPVRALEHALRARGAEPDGALERRTARLRRKVRALRPEQLRLPGIG